MSSGNDDDDDDDKAGEGSSGGCGEGVGGSGVARRAISCCDGVVSSRSGGVGIRAVVSTCGSVASCGDTLRVVATGCCSGGSDDDV